MTQGHKKFRGYDMKVLVSDNLGEAGIKMFEEEPGLTVDVKTGLEPTELKKIIGDYDALVIRSATQVNADLLKARLPEMWLPPRNIP
jgi:D-3-phosphoglycerate dehydrogenase